MTNIEGIKKINELLEQNPGIDIMFMADSDIHCGEEYAWSRCAISSVQIEDVWYSDKEECYKTGMSDIEESISFEVEDELEYEHYSRVKTEEVETEVNRRIELFKSNGEIKKYILVELGV